MPIFFTKDDTEKINEAREQERINAELLFYERQRKADIDIEFDRKRLQLEKELIDREREIVEFEKKCHKQLGEWEHEFHQKKEDDRTALAKLEAKLEQNEELIEVRNKLLESKDAEIARLTELINNLIDKHPDGRVDVHVSDIT